jgi:hypothetical protein
MFDERNPNQWDCSLLDFDEFISFAFEDGEAQKHGSHVFYLWCAHPTRIVEHIRRMCLEFASIAARFPLDKLDQRLWRVLGPQFGLAELLWSADVQVNHQLRIDTVKSMYRVFADFVAPNSLEVGQKTTFFFMWWDNICDGPWFTSGLIERASKIYSRLDQQRRELLDATVWTCREMLNLDDQFIAICAFHGFGHSHHPRVPDIVDNFLGEKGKEFPPETVEWMRQCKEFNIM